jgi:hypothetical protein
MEKCCDACGDGEYYFRSSCLASEGADVSRASIAVDRKSMDKRWLSGRGKTPTLCVIPVFRALVMQSVVTIAVTGNTISGRVVRRHVMQEFEWLR